MSLSAQDDLFGPEKKTEKKPVVERSVFAGIGIGLDYGAIGGQLSLQPNPQLKVFGGIGYNLVGLGYNVGGGFRVTPQNRACIVLNGMYGSNATILVKGLEQYNKTYYGITVGGGVELRGKHNNSHWLFAIDVPFRDPQFTTDWDAIKKIPGIEVQQEPLPITITAGYNFGL